MKKAENAAKPGHLREGELHLVQTPKAREAMGRGSQRVAAFKKIKAPELNWKSKR